MKTIYVAVLVLCLSGCGSSESYEEKDARYQVAKKECSLSAAKAVINESSPPFDRSREILVMKLVQKCLSSKGFDVEIK